MKLPSPQLRTSFLSVMVCATAPALSNVSDHTTPDILLSDLLACPPTLKIEQRQIKLKRDLGLHHGGICSFWWASGLSQWLQLGPNIT